MGFLTGLFKAAVNVVTVPVAVVADVVKTLEGEEPDYTEKTVSSVGKNLSDAVEDLVDGEII